MLFLRLLVFLVFVRSKQKLCCLFQEGEIEKRKTDNLGESRIEAEIKELRKENSELKQYILALQGEVYGARLAAKYLDKELAGRCVSET